MLGSASYTAMSACKKADHVSAAAQGNYTKLFEIPLNDLALRLKRDLNKK